MRSSLTRLLIVFAVALAAPANALASGGAPRRQTREHAHATRAGRRRIRRDARRAGAFELGRDHRGRARLSGYPAPAGSGSSASSAGAGEGSAATSAGSTGDGEGSTGDGAGSAGSGAGSAGAGEGSSGASGGDGGAAGSPAGPVEAPAPAITGTTYYVSPSGSDANSGTSPSSPWRTVGRVNEADLHPGDGVLFQGGAVFSEATLMPAVSGAPGSPIVFGSYGQGDATLTLGVWFDGRNDLAFTHLAVGAAGNVQGTGNEDVLEWCEVEGSPGVGVNAMGADWTIDDNTVNRVGISGMLLEGEGDTVSGNTITNTGLDTAIGYGMHGIYLKVSDATVTRNTIANFEADGISARYRNSTIAENYIADGPVGIAWFQYDPIAGTSHWTRNTIVGVSEAGIYVSPSDQGGATRESFVIEHNTIEPAPGGVFLDLHPTSGSYLVQENSLV